MFSKIRWHILWSLFIIHLTAFVGWILFSWEAVACMVVMYIVTVIGITGGFHRLVTHESFKTIPPIRWAFVLAGVLAAQGSPVEWVATHRKHHQYSDEPKDPHSPHHGGFWWSHLLWMVRWFSPNEKFAVFRQYGRDILEDRFIRALSMKWVYTSTLLLSVVAIGSLGYAVGGWYYCWSFLTYGVFIRLVLVYHITWAVNSATHVWGYRNHDTTDQSRNLWWVGLLAFGEGWHNNHHASQRAANHGQRWWEIDPTFWLIWMLAKLHLAWNVSVYNMEAGKVEVLYKKEVTGT